MAALANRMIRAARLDVTLYEEVEADRQATGQAMLVVILSSLAAGVGSFTSIGIRGLISITAVALLGWLVWAFLTYLIGARLLPEPQTQADMGQLLRTIGFSSSPGVLRILGLVPGLWALAVVITSLWMLVAMVIAVRQALDYRSTWRAVLVCFAGWLVQLFLLSLVVRPMGWGPPAM
ncbi:MAG: YIP1 family protein [Acidobacteria bacterium]|nr:YIP1 family protein [Acidobacteriota bacterium]